LGGCAFVGFPDGLAHQAGGFITYDCTNKTFQTPSEIPFSKFKHLTKE
jgi:hypothetical protein